MEWTVIISFFKGLGAWAVELLKSRTVQYALIAAGALWLIHHEHAKGVSEGLSQGRSECQTASLQAKINLLERQQTIGADVLKDAQERAQQAQQVARDRQSQLEAAKAAVKSQPEAEGQCLSKEAVDAILAIH